jgi:hypothetical protein
MHIYGKARVWPNHPGPHKDQPFHTYIADRNNTRQQHMKLTGYIAYQQLVRRTHGKEAARKVFSATKALRRKGTLSYHVRAD